MVDRFLLWLRVGVVTAGVSAAMLAGAGLAVADDASTSGADGSASSESSNSTGSKDDSDKDPPGDDQPSANDPEPGDDDDADPGPGTEGPSTEPGEEATEEEPPESPSTEPTEETTEPEPAADDTTSDSDTAETQRPATAKANPQEPAGTLDKPAAEQTELKAKEAVEVEHAEASADPLPATVEPVVVVIEDEATETTATAMAFAAPTTSDELAPTATAQTAPSLLSVIGTVIFNLYAFATRLVGGPAVVPPGSSVTVRQSTLHIDCGDGYDVPADWYIPAAGPEPPTRLIYLQHGFLAQGPWYSYTAATLAEQTNSIVVAPSITSNFLACDACWLGAPPMHKAVADLFEDGNTALADSLRATGYEDALPQRVVLIGHSLGGGLVAGAAGNMVGNDRLAGVIMLDGVGLDGSMAASLDLVPDEIPIYQIAAPAYFWNQNGVGSTALQQARPDRFIGVMLEGGSHVDAMQGGNPLIQFAQELVAGFTEARNVEAAKILMVGWVNDMFDPTGEPEGIYGDPRDVITIDTPAGVATAIALPSSLTKWHLFNLLQPFVALGNAFFAFEPTCVTDTMMASGCQGAVAA